MEKTIIIYGSTTGTCEEIANLIGEKLGIDEIINASDVSEDEINGAQNLILGTSTWGEGELQDDWYSGIDVLKSCDLSGKKVAIFGCGDGESYPDTFCSGMAELFNAAQEKGAEIIGGVSTEGYSFSDSASIIDNKFVGLALDNMNQDDLTDSRVDSWTETLNNELN